MLLQGSHVYEEIIANPEKVRNFVRKNDSRLPESEDFVYIAEIAYERKRENAIEHDEEVEDEDKLILLLKDELYEAERLIFVNEE